jgi:lipopolysaccharide export LptBFGC system permease protein LptF
MWRGGVILGLFLASGATYAVLNFSEKLGVQGDVPVALAAWIPHLVPLGLAGSLQVVAHRRLRTTVV